MAKRTRRRIDRLTPGLAVLGVLVTVAIVPLQLSGGWALPGRSNDLTTADVQRIAPQEAWDLVMQGGAILLDVRSEAEYVQGHAEGAYHYPVGEAQQLAATLPAEGALIFY